MQERDFIPAIGMTSNKFWKEVGQESKNNEADNILVYMGLMLEKASAAHVPVRKADFEKLGRQLTFFDGVEKYKNSDGDEELGWFQRINQYGIESGVRVEHYVISSGIREMARASKIGKFMKMIYASSFWYDHNNVAKWPALALNYTTKTQYLFRINKGSHHVYDHELINDYVPQNERPVPFQNMIFIGDGETDIPCFRLVKDQGGHSIAVHHAGKRGAKSRSDKLLAEGRVNFAAAADYRNGTMLDRIVKGIIEKVAMDNHLRVLGKH